MNFIQFYVFEIQKFVAFSDSPQTQSLSASSSGGEDNETNVSIAETSTELSSVGERSFLILKDSGDSQCQVEVEVLQEDSPGLIEGIPLSPTNELVTQVGQVLNPYFAQTVPLFNSFL